MRFKIPDYILSIRPYVPGKPVEALEREYGITDSIKLASNENPLGPSPLAIRAIREALSGVNRYPDDGAFELIRRIADRRHLEPENVIVGNGSDEVISMLTGALLAPGDEAILPQPSFLMYDISVRCRGARPVPVPLKNLAIDLDAVRDRITPRTRMVFICNPNNPTGTAISDRQFRDFLEDLPPDVVVVVDEAYAEFVRDPDCLNGSDYLRSGRPIAVLRTFSKVYGLAGLRVGYGLMPAELASLLNRVRPPFHVSLPAQVGACAALDDEDFLARTRRLIHEGLDFMRGELARLNITCFPTQANFFMIDVKTDADAVFEKMLREGVIVRSMTSYGFPRYIRVNAGLPEENTRFVRALAKVLS